MSRRSFPISALVVLCVAGCSPEIQVANQANTPPTAQITSPANGAVYADTDTIAFAGTIADADGIETVQSVQWVSDRDGVLETVVPDPLGSVELNTTLTSGTHSIELVATDNAGAETTHAITVLVELSNQIPSAVVTAPSDNGNYVSSTPIDLAGVVSDPQQTPGSLTVVWAYEPANGGARFVIEATNSDSNGQVQSQWVNADAGAWRVMLEVTDQDANTFVDDVFIVVQHPDDADQDGDGYPGLYDCDDTDPTINPAENEICNGVDDDCSSIIDDKDLDSDGHVDEACYLYPGILPRDDCDDSNAFVLPGAAEQADGADNNCDGYIDEGTTLFDDDGDCYCESVQFCNDSINPACLVLEFDDCDDTDPNMSPADGDLDGWSGCDGDCDDTDGALNLADFDGDNFSSCTGDCNDFDILVYPGAGCPLP